MRKGNSSHETEVKGSFGDAILVTYQTYYKRAALGAFSLVAAGAGVYKLIRMLQGK